MTSRSRPEPGEPQYVRQVAVYLEANLARRVRMAQLVSLTGVSGRSIQLGFRRHYGCSPLAFLRTRRLERARTMLLLGIPSTVTEVALACGFEHLSRFAAVYRSRFGELPVETRDRVLRERTGIDEQVPGEPAAYPARRQAAAGLPVGRARLR